MAAVAVCPAERAGHAHQRTSTSTTAGCPSRWALNTSTRSVSGLIGPVQSTTDVTGGVASSTGIDGPIEAILKTATFGPRPTASSARTREWSHPGPGHVPPPTSVSIMVGRLCVVPSCAVRSAKVPRSIMIPVAAHLVNSHIASVVLSCGGGWDRTDNGHVPVDGQSAPDEIPLTRPTRLKPCGAAVTERQSVVVVAVDSTMAR